MSEIEDNPQNVPEIERIKWLISRIDLIHKINIESVETSNNIFRNAGKKTLDKQQKYEKVIFSALGIIFSILLVLIGTEHISIAHFFYVLAVLSIFAITTYGLFSRFESLTNKIYNFLETESNNSRMIYSESQAFTAAQFGDLGFIKLDIIRDYGHFAILLGLANSINLLNKTIEYQTKNNVMLYDDSDVYFESANLKNLNNNFSEAYKIWKQIGLYPIEGYNLVEKIKSTKL